MYRGVVNKLTIVVTYILSMTVPDQWNVYYKKFKFIDNYMYVLKSYYFLFGCHVVFRRKRISVQINKNQTQLIRKLLYAFVIIAS